MKDKNQLVSIIIPTFKGENTINILIKEIIKICKNINFEIVVVNDASPDSSNEILLSLYNSYPEIITYIKLEKNAGEYNAVMAGLRNCKGNLAITVDDDLQHPPIEVLNLINESINSNFDVIYTEFKKYNYSFIRSYLSRFYNFTANITLNKPQNIYLSSFKSIKRKVINEIIKYEGNYAYIDGLIFSSTKNIGTFLVNHEFRKVGQSGYTLKKFAVHYGNLLFNFSILPLRLLFLFGLFASLIIFIFLIIFTISKIGNPNITTGYPVLILLIIFFFIIQILFSNFIIDYIGKILKIIKKDKQYIIDFIKENKKK